MRFWFFVCSLMTLLSCAAPSSAQSLYWLDTNYGTPTLNRSDLNGLGVSSVTLGAGTLPEGLAADATGRVYWTEAAWTNARLQRVVHDLTNTVTLVPGGSVLRGIAVDEVGQKLYWTSSNLLTGSKVLRSSIGGGGAAPLIALSASANPRGIAVDRTANKIFWADFDQDALYSAGLDGSAAAVWLSLSPGSAPYGIAVDPTTHQVYWTEYGTGMLRRADAGATNVTPIASGLASPTYLALHATSGRLFWTEGGVGSQRLRRANTNGTGLVTLPPALSTYGGVAIGSGSAVSVGDDLPVEFALDRVWPSPGSAPLHVAFALPREAQVKLSILDLQGRVVEVLADGLLPAGRHERSWSGRLGGGTPAGVYFARLQADGRSWVRRVVIAG